MNGGRTGIADSLQSYENWSSGLLPFARGEIAPATIRA